MPPACSKKFHLVESKFQCFVKLEYPLLVASLIKTKETCQETQEAETEQAHSKITRSGAKAAAAAHGVL